MKQETLLEVVHDNPESTILIEQSDPVKKIVRIDVDEYENFDVRKGKVLSDVEISGEEKERRKRRKDLKLKFTNAGITSVRQVYTISRINENQEDKSDIKDVQKQQRNRRSPGS